jgi:Cu/Ag efflux protein CusF
MTLSVDEAMLTTLGQLKAGDKVKITYEEMGGKFIAKTIAKA